MSSKQSQGETAAVNLSHNDWKSAEMRDNQCKGFWRVKEDANCKPDADMSEITLKITREWNHKAHGQWDVQIRISSEKG